MDGVERDHTELRVSRGTRSVMYDRLRYQDDLARWSVPASARLQAEGGRPALAKSQAVRPAAQRINSIHARVVQVKEGRWPEIRARILRARRVVDGGMLGFRSEKIINVYEAPQDLLGQPYIWHVKDFAFRMWEVEILLTLLPTCRKWFILHKKGLKGPDRFYIRIRIVHLT
jgi:hypothetical protein